MMELRAEYITWRRYYREIAGDQGWGLWVFSESKYICLQLFFQSQTGLHLITFPLVINWVMTKTTQGKKEYDPMEYFYGLSHENPIVYQSMFEKYTENFPDKSHHQH